MKTFKIIAIRSALIGLVMAGNLVAAACGYSVPGLFLLVAFGLCLFAGE